ncbi:MAG: hypothetical protein IPN34_25765 [Planctomycetes bacterium]|nr:hypothetical protein [Planctomycetota bacterium]
MKILARITALTALLLGAALSLPAQEPAPPAKPPPGVPPIQHWLVRGPFPLPRGGDPLARGGIDEEKEKPEPRKPWTAVRSPRSKLKPFTGVDRAGESGIIYVSGHLHLREERELLLWIGSRSPLRLWLDGKARDFPAQTEEGSTALRPLRLQLDRGAHCWLIKLARTSAREPELEVFFSALDGSSLDEVAFTLSSAAPTPMDWVRSSAPALSPAQLFEQLPQLEKLDLGFDKESDADQLAIVGGAHDYLPTVLPATRAPRTYDGLAPPSGARGVLVSHPVAAELSLRLYAKLTIPAKSPRLELRAAAEHERSEGKGDCLLRVAVFDGGELQAIGREVIGPRGDPPRAGWQDLSFDLAAYAGRTVLLEVECASGGPRGDYHFDHLFLDSLRLR